MNEYSSILTEIEPLKRVQVIAMLSAIAQGMDDPDYTPQQRVADCQTLKTIVAKL